MSQLGTSEVQGDSSEYRKLAKSLSENEPIVQRFREYKAVVRDIAQTKMPDLNATTIEAAEKIIAGTARSMGIKVEK